MADPAHDSIAEPRQRPLGWGVYLASSWTWCIGMFLPILLVRDFGTWGFVAFAVPNVVGAAAMGWILASRRVSAGIVERHRPACVGFSAVTLAFHAFFAGYVLAILARVDQGGEAAPPAVLLVALAPLVAIAVALLVRRARLRLGAGIAWTASLAVASLLLADGQALQAWRLAGTPPASPLVGDTSLLWLTPAMAMGFMLCPYLDLTFHHARRRLDPVPARVAFTVGFGGFFLLMILTTLLYGQVILAGSASTLVVRLIAAHILVQWTFTIAVHASAVREIKGSALVPAVAVIAGAIVAGAWLLLTDDPDLRLRTGEVIYRLFMSFYGLLAPAYVWICMIPTRDGHAGLDGPRGRRKALVLVAAVLAAALPYWMGFIEGREIWLGPGVGVLLSSRLLVR